MSKASTDPRVKARRAAKRKREQIELEYRISDAGGLQALDLYQTALEDLLYAQAVLEHEGWTVDTTTGGKKSHPLCAIARDARTQCLACLKLLALPIGEHNA